MFAAVSTPRSSLLSSLIGGEGVGVSVTGGGGGGGGGGSFSCRLLYDGVDDE
jgi:hypothetical protein